MRAAGVRSDAPSTQGSTLWSGGQVPYGRNEAPSFLTSASSSAAQGRPRQQPVPEHRAGMASVRNRSSSQGLAPFGTATNAGETTGTLLSARRARGALHAPADSAKDLIHQHSVPPAPVLARGRMHVQPPRKSETQERIDARIMNPHHYAENHFANNPKRTKIGTGWAAPSPHLEGAGGRLHGKKLTNSLYANFRFDHQESGGTTQSNLVDTYRSLGMGPLEESEKQTTDNKWNARRFAPNAPKMLQQTADTERNPITGVHCQARDERKFALDGRKRDDRFNGQRAPGYVRQAIARGESTSTQERILGMDSAGTRFGPERSSGGESLWKPEKFGKGKRIEVSKTFSHTQGKPQAKKRPQGIRMVPHLRGGLRSTIFGGAD